MELPLGHLFSLDGERMEGFSVPVHRSLTQPILLGGAPREFAILNGTLGTALLFGLHSLIGVPVCLANHRPQSRAALFVASSQKISGVTI